MARSSLDREHGGRSAVAPNRLRTWRERYRPEVSIRHWIARRHIIFLPLARTSCRLPDTISFAEPVRGAHPTTGRARTKAPAVRWGFRFVIFPRTRRLARMRWRSHRRRDRWSRGTIPYPPTPHHDRAKADNDRDQDRQDGNSCIILTLPVTEWVSCRTTGFERHNSLDRKSRCRQSYKNAEGEELRALPQVDDRSGST